MNVRKVLIVDDEPHVIRVLRLTLERQGYLVQSAGDGQEALQKMEGFAPDVLVTDIHMDGMDGRILCRTVRERYPQRPILILVMTSMTAIEERDWVRELSNTEFLEKPLSLRQLLARLAQYFLAMQADPEMHHAPSDPGRN